MNPFVITVYDKGFLRRGWVGDPLDVSVNPRHLALPTAEFTVAADHPRLVDLTADGARVTIDYDGQQILSGIVSGVKGTGPNVSGTVTLSVTDDWRLLSRVLGWPNPSASLTAQTSQYDTRTGPAESVVKSFVAANAVTRLGLPLQVAADAARGGTVTVSSRFHPLLDRLLPVLQTANLGVTVKQLPAVRRSTDGRYVSPGLILDCYVPAAAPRVLTEQGGVVQSWEWTKASPTATRTVVGDQGTGTLRVFAGVVDTARESAWGDVIETFTDASDATTVPTMTARGTDALTEGRPTAGLSVTLAETSTFRYGRAVKVGDQVQLQVGPGVVVQDVLTEAKLTWTASDGLTVVPVAGDLTDSPDRALAKSLAGMYRNVRSLMAGR